VELGEIDFLVAVEAGGGLDELFAVEDVEGGPVDGLGLGFAPMPEGPEDGGGAPVQVLAAGDAPGLLRVALLGDGGGGDGLGGALPEPFDATEFSQFLLEDGRDLEQIMVSFTA